MKVTGVFVDRGVKRSGISAGLLRREGDRVWLDRISLVFWILCILLCTSSEVVAQDCDAILRQGIFNQTTVRKGLHVQQDLFQWLSVVSDEEFVSAQKSGLRFAAVVQGIPFDLNGTNSTTELHRLKTSINQGQIQNFTQDEFLQIVQLSVSSEIVNAWLACVTQPGVGLLCSTSANGDHLFQFTARSLLSQFGSEPASGH